MVPAASNQSGHRPQSVTAGNKHISFTEEADFI